MQRGYNLSQGEIGLVLERFRDKINDC